MSKSVLLVFFQEFCSIQSYIQVFIHFEFIFVRDVRECSNFIILHVAVQFSKHHFIGETVLHCYSCLLSCKLIGHKCVSLFLGFYSVLFIYMSVFVPVTYFFDYCNIVVQSEVWECDSFSFVLLSGLLWLFEVFCVSIQIKFFCSSFVENAIGNLIGITLNLQIAVGSMVL